jgi:hypothetical protein
VIEPRLRVFEEADFTRSPTDDRAKRSVVLIAQSEVNCRRMLRAVRIAGNHGPNDPASVGF